MDGCSLSDIRSSGGSGHGPTWDWDKKELQLDWIGYYVIRNGLICFQVSSISV